TKKRRAIREQTLRGLASALGLSHESELTADPLTLYKEFVVQNNAFVDFRGLALNQAEPLRLEKVFVPVRAVPCVNFRNENGCDRHAPHSSVSDEIEREVTVAQCLHRKCRVLLRGEPGSGKTTSL